jgi:hypothetical protein
MSFPKTTLKLILDTLIAGFDGFAVDALGTLLAADKNPDDIDIVSDDLLPFLLFDVGSAQPTPWQAWQEFVQWDVPAILKIKGPPEEVDDIMLEVLQSLMQRTAELIGLPIDETGKVVPFTTATAHRFDKGELQFVAERGAPFLRSFATTPSAGGYSRASLMFHVESTLDLDPRGTLPLALQMRFGVIPMSGSLAADQTLPDPYGIPITADSAIRGIGGYNTPDPLGRTRRPPLRRVAGVAPADIVTAVLVTPYAATLTAGTPTQQLSSIAQYANWNTIHVEQLGAWLSSAPSVATVSAAGLVTRVAAGSTTITCTFNGVVSNGVAITCT